MGNTAVDLFSHREHRSPDVHGHGRFLCSDVIECAILCVTIGTRIMIIRNNYLPNRFLSPAAFLSSIAIIDRLRPFLYVTDDDIHQKKI